jgi:hypothetical protein
MRYRINVKESGACDSSPSRWVRSFGASIGIGYKWLANLAFTISGTRTAVLSGISAIQRKEKSSLKKTLVSGVKHHVIIYDNEEETGWLISHSSLFLFLAQVYLLQNNERPFEVLPSDVYCSPALDGGEAALEQIKFLIEAKADWPSADESFEDLLRTVTHHLGLVQHEIRQVYTAHIDVAPTKILGVGLLDVALRMESMSVKSAKVNNPWAYFTAHQPCFVLFCKNLGQAIVPSFNEGLCSDWISIPPQKNYLVAAGHSLLYLLREQRGVSRLADRIFWDLNVPWNPLVKLHSCMDQNSKCQHVQWLSTKKPNDLQEGRLSELIKTFKDGGYIFTNRDYWVPTLGRGKAVDISENSMVCHSAF